MSLSAVAAVRDRRSALPSTAGFERRYKLRRLVYRGRDPLSASFDGWTLGVRSQYNPPHQIMREVTHGKRRNQSQEISGRDGGGRTGSPGPSFVQRQGVRRERPYRDGHYRRRRKGARRDAGGYPSGR